MSDFLAGRALIKAADLNQYRKADELLTEARAQADAILSEAEAILSQAHAQSRRQREELAHQIAGEVAGERLRGYAHGRQQAADECASLLIEHRARLSREWREQDSRIIDLVMTVLGRLLREEDLGAGFFARVAERVLREAQNGRPLVIRVAPSQLMVARERLRQAWEAQDVPRFIDLQAAPTLPEGSCRIESDTQSIDASLDTQLEVIHKALRQAFATSWVRDSTGR